MSTNNGHRSSSNSNGGDSSSSRNSGASSSNSCSGFSDSDSEDDEMNDDHTQLLQGIWDASANMINVCRANPFQRQAFFDQLRIFLDVIEGAVNQGVTLHEWEEYSALEAFIAATQKARCGHHHNMEFCVALGDLKERFGETIYRQWNNTEEHDDSYFDAYDDVIFVMRIDEANDEYIDEDNELHMNIQQSYDSCKNC